MDQDAELLKALELDDRPGVTIVESVSAPRPQALPSARELGQRATKLVSFEDILTATHLPEKEIPVPEWGGVVVIKAFTRKQAEAIRRESVKRNDDGVIVPDRDLAERLTFKGAIIRPTLSMGEVEAIFERQHTGLIEMIFREINKVNGYEPEQQKAAEDSFRPQR